MTSTNLHHSVQSLTLAQNAAIILFPIKNKLPEQICAQVEKEK